jgi:hypothetical protein
LISLDIVKTDVLKRGVVLVGARLMTFTLALCIGPTLFLHDSVGGSALKSHQLSQRLAPKDAVIAFYAEPIFLGNTVVKEG